MLAKDNTGSGPSLVERAFTRLMTRSAVITDTVEVSPKFRMIDFEGKALRNSGWTPGDKAQIKLAGMMTRTYTPFEWNEARGSMRILACLHAAGPGSAWASQARPGERRQIFGPRSSLRLNDLPPSTVLFGDETSIGLAIALHRGGNAGSLRLVCEAENVAEMACVLDRFSLSADIVQRQAEDAHAEALADTVARLVAPGTAFVLSGKAQSIQHVHRALKARGVERRRIRTKAYWAPGKGGLD